MDDTIYDPSDDSFMLASHVKRLAKGNVLDMGTGSGIQAEAAMASPYSKAVLGVDTNRKAVEYCRKMNPSINFLESNLFSRLKGQVFDTIIFNPPYLPEGMDGITDPALIGGKHGHETISEFLDSAPDHLSPDGFILLLFSSHTNKEMVDRTIIDRLLEAKELERKSIFFEELYVYCIVRGELLKRLDSQGVKQIRRFAHGKRGIIFTGMMKGKKVGIKVPNPSSKAVARMENEGGWLSRMNEKGIGPSLISYDESHVIYEFAEGLMIDEFMKLKSPGVIRKAMLALFSQMRKMDEMKVDKEEMHHPWKHIILSPLGKPVLIDFERCRVSLKPKNVTQFCQFIGSRQMISLLKKKGINIDKANLQKKAEMYKKKMDARSYEAITKILG